MKSLASEQGRPLRCDQEREGSLEGRVGSTLSRELRSPAFPAHRESTGGVQEVVYRGQGQRQGHHESRNEGLWGREIGSHDWTRRETASGDSVTESTRLGDPPEPGREGRGGQAASRLSALENWGDGESHRQSRNFYPEGHRQAIQPESS